jgi:hypothetical protein
MKFLIWMIPLAMSVQVRADGPCAVPPGTAATRPDAGSSTEVIIGLFLVDLKRIDDASQSFNADLALSASWRDPRLVEDPEYSLAGCRISLQSLWHPRLAVLNEGSLRRRLPDEVTISSDGTILYRQRFVGDLTHSFALREFPFDAQDLEIQIVSWSYGTEEVEFVVDRDRSGRRSELTIVEWATGDGAVRSEPLFVESAGRSLPRIVSTMNVTRLGGFYWWKVFLPLSLIVLMSCAVFWINPSFLTAQLSVSTASVLTLIAFQFSLGYLLPRLSYLTRADRFVLGSTILVFLAFGEALMTGYLAGKKRQARAERIDRHARWIFPLSFVLVCLRTLKF